jgi:hypothetical protein
LGVVRKLIGQELQRYETAEARILGLIDDAHAATAEFFYDAIVGNHTPEDGREVSHFAGILRPLPDNCREQGLSLAISR